MIPSESITSCGEQVLVVVDRLDAGAEGDLLDDELLDLSSHTHDCPPPSPRGAVFLDLKNMNRRCTTTHIDR